MARVSGIIREIEGLSVAHMFLPGLNWFCVMHYSIQTF